MIACIICGKSNDYVDTNGWRIFNGGPMEKTRWGWVHLKGCHPHTSKSITPFFVVALQDMTHRSFCRFVAARGGVLSCTEYDT